MLTRLEQAGFVVRLVAQMLGGAILEGAFNEKCLKGRCHCGAKGDAAGATFEGTCSCVEVLLWEVRLRGGAFVGLCLPAAPLTTQCVWNNPSRRSDPKQAGVGRVFSITMGRKIVLIGGPQVGSMG